MINISLNNLGQTNSHENLGIHILVAFKLMLRRHTFTFWLDWKISNCVNPERSSDLIFCFRDNNCPCCRGSFDSFITLRSYNGIRNKWAKELKSDMFGDHFYYIKRFLDV